MLWDTAGQEEFDAITKAYYRGAQACVIAFSTVDRVSLGGTNIFTYCRCRKQILENCTCAMLKQSILGSGCGKVD